jgi:hypothetical protein
VPELASTHGPREPKREGDHDSKGFHDRVQHKLRAYRVAGNATCPEAIISYLLLYALLYILKHVSQNSRVAATELHEVSRTTKPRKASLSFLSKLSMLSLHLPLLLLAAGWFVGNGSLDESTCKGRLKVALPKAWTVLQPQLPHQL